MSIVDRPSAGPATPAELAHLWWFADGAIMDVGTRDHLYRSWGLCGRHAWLYFRVETELRVDPLGNAVLLADLVSRAAEAVQPRHMHRGDSARLVATASCFTCDYLTGGATGSERFAAQLRAVNAGTRAADWCLGCRDIWERSRCPRCAGVADECGVLCRRHVVERGAPAAQRPYLQELASRVVRCQKSLTADGPARTPDSDAALVESLGWCSGWHPELALRSAISARGSR
jgi:hypothetical protein